ncbi:MAG: SMEK domain-containing protein [Firmicutes bacterium]|nr:SMEK domain-containing protein [Bacillota bacterium]
MNLLEKQHRIQQLMATFVAEAKAASAISRTDLNHVAEIVLIPLFKIVYGLDNLKNLNTEEEANYPGIDLGDDVARVAVQVTATSESEKIKDTLRKFVKYKLYEKYDRLIIYILTEKQRSYSGSGFDEIIQGRITFDKNRDIMDYRDMLREIGSFQIDKISCIENILEANFGDANTPMFGHILAPQTERVFLNMLPLRFPERLYLGNVVIDFRDDEQPDQRQYHRGRQGPQRCRFASKRDQIRVALQQRGLRFATGWEYHEGKIFTFHNLYDEGNPLRSVIDIGTIESMASREFYSIDENYERIFKSLLRRSLQQLLYHRGVWWQSEENFFIFVEQNGLVRRVEKWQGKKINEREVFVRTMKDNKPDEILKCKHLAFSTQFRRIDNDWYLVITPDWFFSIDGYRKSPYCEDDLKWLKLKENNSHIANHLRFIAYFLRHQQRGLFDEDRWEGPRFLTFGEFVSFGDAPLLIDNKWLPTPDADDEENDIFVQGELDI